MNFLKKTPEQKDTTPTVSVEPVSLRHQEMKKAADANDNKAGQENEKRLSANQKIAIGIVVAYLFGAALVFQKVSNTEIDATVITSSATFLLKKQWMINEIEAGDRINAGKAFWTSDKLLNQTEAEMKAFTESGKPVLLRQLTIPAGVRVTVGRQTRGNCVLR